MLLENTLKKFRFNNNQLTQEELAKELNVSRQTILAIENSKFNPSVTLALRMAKFFNCKVEDLFILKEEGLKII